MTGNDAVAGIEVVVPIFNAAEATAACLDALATRLPDWAGVQLVDDHSTDPAIDHLLSSHRLVRAANVRVIRQQQNQGFVVTVNAAMARSDHDIVLLNSDTVVTSGWLERLRACADSDPAIATATPFSNNAEICSLPTFCRANPVPDDPEAIAAIVAGTGRPEYPDLPTGVGFCMFIRRRALAAVGDFDAATFGRGYGEENDWCLRASGHGWRHVLCDDAYVVHVGGLSFADTASRPGGQQLARLLARYPHYNARIAEFIARDPFRVRRQAIAARLPG
ncbi:MAG: glycosyltransferase family 2 protein [Xanthomonadales bacterium]|nr:glycosyltransferase family 2 protein [Xanthomonadales bacterium]